MKEVEKKLDFGVIEKRIYDDNDRLIEIRKVYPPERPNQKNPLFNTKLGEK